MAQVLMIKNKGLATANNEFSEIPAGGMTVAENVSIDKDSIVEPRRGHDRQVPFPDGSDRGRRIGFFQSNQIMAYSNGKVGYKNGSVVTPYSGTYNDPDSTNARLRFLNAGSNLYWTTSTGVYRLDAYNGTPVLSGIPKGLDVQLALAGAGAMMPVDSQLAYRVVWGFKDANGTVFLGAPSGRAVITNPAAGAASNVTATFTIPSGITTSYFYQVYRSAESGEDDVEPSDELGLVYENSPTSGELAASPPVVTYTDSTPDSLRGATLYTSPSQEGILQSNERPPLADDITQFSNCVFYANCESKHRKNITLISAATLANNDTIIIAGTTYTAKTAGETISSGFFKLFTAGSAAQNIADTANSLIRVINRYATNTLVYAYLLSGQNDLPGQILIEERGIGGNSFAFTANSAGSGLAWNPVLPTSGTSVSSSSDDYQHQIFFSKPDKQEAVPLLNYRFVGSANNAIRRVLPLGNSLFIYKEKEGIYRITGTYPNFDVELFDSSAVLLAPDSLAVVNNQQWALTDQGATIISETGTSVVSRPIEDLILDQTGTALAQLKQYSFGIGYETDRKYILWTVNSSADTYATKAYVWNTFTKAWTTWDLPATTGTVSPDDGKLYYCRGDNFYTMQERKTLTYTDFADETIAVSISAFSGMTVTLSSTTGLEVGDVLVQSTNFSIIIAINGLVLTVADTLSGWTVAAASVLKVFSSTIEYAAVTGGNPGTLKQFPEVSFLFKAARFNNAVASFATDASGSFEEVPILGNSVGAWGIFPWGQSPWGATSVSVPIRTYIPLEKQRGSLIRVKLQFNEAYSAWKLNGFSMPIRDTNSTRIGSK